MTLKRKYDSADQIPVYARGLYTESEDGFTVIEGVDLDEMTRAFRPSEPDKNEFRDNNRRLKSQLDQTKARLGELEKMTQGVDPESFEAYREQLQREQDEEDRKLLERGLFDQVYERKSKRFHEEKNKEIAERQKAYEKLEREHSKLRDRYAQDRAINKMTSMIEERQLRTRPNAREDLAVRIREDWTLDDRGELVPRRQDLLGEDGAPISPTAYVDRELIDRRNYFFEPATGGGARGADGGGPDGGRTIASDPETFGKNLDAIAKGKVRVNRDQ